MFIRRAAAVLLVDAQMAIRSGAWTPSRTHSPFAAIDRLEATLASPASDEVVGDALDALHQVVGAAMMAGEAAIDGYEQFEIGDVHPALVHKDVPGGMLAANDDAPLRRAA